MNKRCLACGVHKVDVCTVFGKELDAIIVAAHASYLKGAVFIFLGCELKINCVTFKK